MSAHFIQDQDAGVGGALERFCINYRLTPRQQSVLTALVAGRAPKEIAGDLGVAESTVRFHAIAMYQRCGVHNQREMLALFARAMHPRLPANEPASGPTSSGGRSAHMA